MSMASFATAASLAEAAAATALAAPALRRHDATSPGRSAVEDFIRRVYHRRYGASVSSFMPDLIALHDPSDGEVIAACGYRGAAQGPLFLEAYLGEPVEAVLARHADAAPARSDVVEIGHLAAERAGAGRQLMQLLGPLLARQRFCWATCTLTRELRHLIVRMGITPLALGRAGPQALGADAAAWGSYYDHEPLVLAGQIRPALRRLARPSLPAGCAR